MAVGAYSWCQANQDQMDYLVGIIRRQISQHAGTLGQGLFGQSLANFAGETDIKCGSKRYGCREAGSSGAVSKSSSTSTVGTIGRLFILSLASA